MGRYIGPQCRYCRTEHRKLFLKGERCYGAKCPISKKSGAPGKSMKDRPRKMSDYGIQLREKQKVKRMYGMLEKQFKLFFTRAEKMPGVTGDNLVSLLERRLDNMVYRMRFASSRKLGRQIVLHGHVMVNGRRITIPSYVTRENDVVQVAENSKKMLIIKESLKEFTRSGAVPWLDVDPDQMKGTVKALPRKSDVMDLADIKEQLIVELYSR
ncbi:MAG: 30S ribosomal protein S4 [Spirochaetales bacterium]|nr:MAG: 30S ribosomal protein S4 [Spirochaetales bacterium]